MSELRVDCSFKLEHDRDPYAQESSPRCDKCGLCGCADDDVFVRGHPQYCSTCCPGAKQQHLVHEEPPFLNHDPFAYVACLECKQPRTRRKSPLPNVSESGHGAAVAATAAEDVGATAPLPSTARLPCDDFRVLRLEASKFNGRAIGPHLPGYVEFRADKSDEPVAGAAEFLAELAPQLFLDGAVCAAVPFRGPPYLPLVAIIAEYCSRLGVVHTDRPPRIPSKRPLRRPRYATLAPAATPPASHRVDIKRCRVYVPNSESLAQRETQCVVIVRSFSNSARLVFAYDDIPVHLIRRVFSSGAIHTEPRTFVRTVKTEADHEEERTRVWGSLQVDSGYSAPPPNPDET